VRLLLLLLLLALAAGAAAGLFLHDEAGYVLISVGPWIVETSVLGFVTLAVVVLAAAYYGAKLVVVLLRLPTLFKEARATRRSRLAQESFESGLEQLLEGQWARAEVELVRRAADHRAPGLNYLLAARAAQRGGAPERREHYLALAGRQGGMTPLAVELVRAELMFERRDLGAALPVLEALYRQQPKHPYVIELLAETTVRLSRWEPLRKLLATAEGARALTPARYRELYGQALRQHLLAAGETARLEALKAAWDAVPAEFRARTDIRSGYLRSLARFGADAEVAAQVVQMLQQGWDRELVDIYSELGGLDPVGQLATVEQWLNQHGERPELLLAAGRVCTRNRLWGKARSYLDAALRLQPSAAVYLALAKVCEQSKQPEEASLFYRRGLELAADSRPGQVSKA
jgi:HemY protein